jgi:quercetin dioxygenase-like cupin family protein
MIPEHIRHFFNESSLEEEIVEGNIRRVIYTGDNIQIILYHFPPQTKFPLHTHDKHEQMGYLVSGKMGFNVGGDIRTLNPGDFYRAPIGVEHNAWTLDEPSVLLDFFSPVREDLAKW